MGLFNYYTQVHPGGQLTFIEGKISDFQPHNRIGSGKNILRMESFIKALIKKPIKRSPLKYQFYEIDKTTILYENINTTNTTHQT